MKHNYLSVSSLFSQPGRYVVPLFQRPYVWTEEEQWKPLWDDIRRVADDVIADKGNTRSHFLGSVVLEQQHTPAGHLATREVIDGQQRLATLQLLLKAAADMTLRSGATLAAGQLSDLVHNRHVSNSEPLGRFKVWPTEADQAAYAAVMDAEQGKIPNKFVGHAFAQAYWYFAGTINNWLEPSPAERAEALSTALHQQIKLMALDIDPGEDAQVIFETLNARGTPLLPLDLVKNWLLREAVKKKADVANLYRDHWREAFDLEIDYWREEVGRGHAQRPRADLFLQNFLTMRLREEVASDRLYYRFLDDVKKHDETIVKRVATIEQNAAIFREIDQPDDESALGRRFARIKELDFLTTYPLLMVCRGRSTDQELLKLMEMLESFIVRRLVCGLSTRGYGTFFLDLMVQVTGEQKNLVKAAADFLSKSNAEGTRWPSDTEFKEAWMTLPLYERLARPRLRFILRALEEYLRTADGLTEPFVVPSRLEIEHIMPQSWEAHWPLLKGASLTSSAADDRRTLIHTIGNLTLLTKKLNSTLSNAPWSTDLDEIPCKKKTIHEYSLMMLSKDVVGQKKWSEQTIAERGERLFKQARKIWPHP